MRQTVVLLICVLCVAVLTPAARAAVPPPADTLKVDYFSNANGSASTPIGQLRLTNPNTNGGNINAAIYVFDTTQEMSECCECLLTPDGLATLSVNVDLTSNPLTGPPLLTTGLIKIVSTTGVNPDKLAPTAAVRAWGTHIQGVTTFSVTETASQDATLSTAEVTRLDGECASIELDGSGHGICSCGTGGT